MDTPSTRKTGLVGILRSIDPTMRLILIIGFVEMTAVSFYATVLMPYYRSLGFQSEIAGILTSVLQTVSAVVLTVAGLAADRLGRKKLYVAGQVMRCLVPASLLVVRNFPGLVFVSVLRGLASVQSPAQSAIVAGYTEKSTRATILAVSQTMGQVASFVAPLAAGAIADAAGVRIPFAIGLTLAVAATVLGLRVKEAKAAGPRDDEPAQSAAPDGAVSVRPDTQNSSLSYGARVKRMFAENNSRALSLVLMANIANGLSNGATNILLPFTIMDKFSSAYKTVSGAQAAGALGTMLVLLIGGRIADVHGRKGIVAWSAVLFPLALCSIFFVQSIWQIYAMLLFVTMLGNISSPAIMALHLEMVGSRDQASFSGLTGGLSSAALAVGSTVSGFAYRANPKWAWAATILLFAAQGLLYTLALSSQEKAEAASSATELA